MSDPQERPTADADAFFEDRFGLGDAELATALDTALERRVDHADLFFEYATHDSVTLEEGIVKSGDRHLEQGVGVRVQAGERQGYAHSDDVTVESVRLAATSARAISRESGGARSGSVAVTGSRGAAHDLYPVVTAPTQVPVDRKVDLLSEIDAYARSLDPRVKQVMASTLSQDRQILIVGSDGTRAADVRPLVRLNVQVIAADATGSRREVGYQGMGGRWEFDRLLDPKVWRPLVDEAVRIAVLNLESVPCPAGTMNVVLGPGWPGILLHEAIGHGLEGDFNRKKTSAFSDKLGQRVAAPGVTVVDDGTLPGRRGSLNVDDEGCPTRRTVLIEDGILVGYLQDRLNARLMGMEPTGNGRRESYAHLPMPRMTNTFMLAGEEDPADVLASVDHGLYAVSFGGGQVDITSGKFVFSASEAYKIEGGRIGAPVKGATLIGNGPDVLTRVSRIGNDLALDQGVGTCGKDGQSVPVGVGLPTLRIDGLTVGGTEGVSDTDDLRDRVERALASAARAGADRADALLVARDSVEGRVRGEEVEFVTESREHTLGVRALVAGDGGFGSAIASTSDLSDAAVDRIAADAAALARATAPDPAAGLPESGFAEDSPDLGLAFPEDRHVDVETRLQDAFAAERAARATDERITNSEGSQIGSGHSRIHYASSAGFSGGYVASSHSLFSEPLAAQNGSMQRDYWMTVARRLADCEPAEAVGRRAADRALRRLGARSVATCEAPVIFDPVTAPSLLGHLAACVNGYSIYRETSYLAGKLGESVAAAEVTVVDDGRRPGGLGSKPFDGEGLPTRRTRVVDRGRLASWLLDDYSARKLGLASTGNATRGPGSAPSAAPTNLWLEPGDGSLEEIVASTDRGLLVTELIGMGFNPVTGDYSRGAAGLWIEGGEIAHPVEGVTIAGNLAEMLAGIDRIGADLLWLGRLASPSLRIARMTIAGA